jgi:hypothetical protein
VQNFNKIALRVLRSRRRCDLTSVSSRSRTFLHSRFPSGAKEEESAFRRDAETSTPGGVRSSDIAGGGIMRIGE